MDPLSHGDVLSQLASGLPIRDILRRLTPSDHRKALDRCAVARSFDRDIFVEVCKDLPLELTEPFEKVIAHPDVRRLPDGRFRLKQSAREVRIREWITEARERGEPGTPLWLQDVSRRLVRYYESVDETEACYHRLAYDEPGALIELQRLYDEADRRFALPRCQDLIDMVDERIPLIGPQLASERNRLQAYLDTRAYWSEHWYRTAPVVLPDETVDAVETLLADDGPRVLRIIAPDGFGKTTLLQWMIARRCVIEPDRYACAQIDFNDIGDQLLATQEPWLLLLEAARQLDRQLSESPFHELLLEHEAHCERLLWSGARARPTALPAGAPETAEDRERLAEEVRTRFYDAVPAGQRILLAFDSIEAGLLADSSHARQARLRRVVTEMKRVLDQLPRTRIVVAMEAGTNVHVPPFDEEMRPQTLRPSALDDDSAREYLATGRRLALTREVEDAVVAAGRGVPFRLALLADVLKRRPDADAATIAKLERAKPQRIAALVTAELDEPLRGGLGLGVAPRALDAEYVEGVVAPLLQTDGSRLWRLLRDFAADSPWVTAPGPYTLRYHPLLAHPAREALRLSERGRAIHARSSEWYRQRADRDPDRWGSWMSEAIYHAFQVNLTDAVEMWRDVMIEAEGRDARHAERLGRELLRQLDLGPGDLRDEAWLECAWANVRLVRSAPGAPAGHDGWERAEAALEEVTGTAQDGARAAIVRAALSERLGEHDKAVVTLRDAIAAAGSARDRLALRVEYARALQSVDPAEAIREYQLAAAKARRMHRARPDPIWIDLRRAWALRDLERPNAARRIAEAALERVQPNSRTRDQLRLLLAELALRDGRATEVKRMLTDVGATSGRIAHQAGLLQARAQLERGARRGLSSSWTSCSYARARTAPARTFRNSTYARRRFARSEERPGAICSKYCRRSRTSKRPHSCSTRRA